VAASILAAGAAAAAETAPDRGAEKSGSGGLEALYATVAPAVVGLTCRREGDYYGTGVLIDPAGLVMTSVTVVPQGARDIRVYLRGGRVATAELLKAVADRELSLLRIENMDRLLAEGEAALPHLKLGDSARVRIGEPSYALGNAFLSIQQDDRVTLAAGLVSGLYDLKEKRSQATYVGPAIETTAALNNGMDGGPLLNGAGEIIGLLSLNYSRSRWLGTAVPVNKLKPIIAGYRGWLDDRLESYPVYAGLEIEQVGGRDIRILRVRAGSPAAAAGLRPGDVLKGCGGARLSSVAGLRRQLERARPGDELELELERDGTSQRVTIVLWGRF
jgi:S1-C subfamily serine protease